MLWNISNGLRVDTSSRGGTEEKSGRGKKRRKTRDLDLVELAHVTSRRGNFFLLWGVLHVSHKYVDAVPAQQAG
eukprot:3934133-Rhodomonas_salina.3